MLRLNTVQFPPGIFKLNQTMLIIEWLQRNMEASPRGHGFHDDTSPQLKRNRTRWWLQNQQKHSSTFTYWDFKVCLL